MKFSVFVALIGSTAAVRYYDCPQPKPILPCQQKEQQQEQAQFTCDDQQALPLPAYSGQLDAASRLPQPGAGGCDGYGRLSSESAASKTTIGASQLTIPDKNIVTDQAKVHESVAKGERKAQTCQVARRKFSINGEITVDEKYNDNLKGDETSKKCGQGAAQTRSRTQVLNVCSGGNVQVPPTAQFIQRPSTCGCNNS